MRNIAIAGVLAISLPACSFVPDVEYTYYPAKSSVVASVTQTITCTPDQSALVVENTVVVNPTYAADYSKRPFRFRPADVDGVFGSMADSDAAFTFYDDGRLKGINQTTTGQGEAAIKAAVSLATTVAAIGGAAPAQAAPKALPICDTVKKMGAGKGVTLKYSSPVTTDIADGNPVHMDLADDSSKAAAASLGKAAAASSGQGLPQMDVVAQKTDADMSAGAHWTPPAGTSSATALLHLQPVVHLTVQIMAGGHPIWNGDVALAGTGHYDLPIPRAALFGEQKFSLSLAESGAITAIDYGKTSGAAGAFNAGNAIAGTQTPPTAAAKAAEVKGESDLIYQNRRHAACVAAPATCSAN